MEDAGDVHGARTTDTGVPSKAGSASPDRVDAHEITRLLEAHAAGDESALDRLIPLVYDDLRRIAHQRLESDRRPATFDTTAIVHEAYLRLVDVRDPDWSGRAHFFAVSSRLIRNLLIDFARKASAEKRGGNLILLPLNEELDAGEEDAPAVVDLLALDDALTALARQDPRLVEVVEHRFFGGLTVGETASLLRVSTRTVERDWTRAKAYLHQALTGS